MRPIKDEDLFDKCLGSDRFNVTADGNTTLSRWKRINALFVGSFKINRSDTRELNWRANAIRSSEKCSTVFQKYTALTFRAAINVNCTVPRREHPCQKSSSCSLLQQRRPIDNTTRCIYSNVYTRLTFARILGDVLLIGSQVWHAIINIRDQCQDSCHYHGSPNYAHIRHITASRYKVDTPKIVYL